MLKYFTKSTVFLVESCYIISLGGDILSIAFVFVYLVSKINRFYTHLLGYLTAFLARNLYNTSGFFGRMG